MPFATTTKMPWNAFHFCLVALLNSTSAETVNELLPHFHGAFEMLAKNIIFPFHCWVYDFQWRGMFCIFNYNFQFSLTFARLRHTDKNRHIHTNMHTYSNCMLNVECKLNCKRCTNILRCVEYSTPNKIIFIQRVCNGRMLCRRRCRCHYHRCCYHRQTYENLARPINFMQKSNAKTRETLTTVTNTKFKW